MKEATTFVRKKKPILIGAGVIVGAGGLYALSVTMGRREAFRLAADGNVNALAAQQIGEKLPAAWKNANWFTRTIMPSSIFSAAREVEDWFKSESFKSQMFKVTETVTEVKQFERCFRAMWGFSFMKMLSKNLPSADQVAILSSLRREKVRATPKPEFRGLYMVSKKPLTPADVAAIINGSMFATNSTIPAGFVLGVSDGNSIAKGKIKEGYSAVATYANSQGKVTVTVIADKTKVEFMTQAQVTAKKLKPVPVTYLKK